METEGKKGKKARRIADSALFWVGVSVAILLVIMGAGYWYGRKAALTGQLNLRTFPADATVLVDGQLVDGRSPFFIPEKTGLYTVVVTRDGYISKAQQVWIPARQVVRATITLTPATGPSP